MLISNVLKKKSGLLGPALPRPRTHANPWGSSRRRKPWQNQEIDQHSVNSNIYQSRRNKRAEEHSHPDVDILSALQLEQALLELVHCAGRGIDRLSSCQTQDIEALYRGIHSSSIIILQTEYPRATRQSLHTNGNSRQTTTHMTKAAVCLVFISPFVGHNFQGAQV